jgi:two-component system, OmpR family, response regulator
MNGEAQLLGDGMRQGLIRSAAEFGTPSAQVLVVDDDIEAQGIVVDYLEDHGVRAIRASGWRGISDHFSGSEPDLVVLASQRGGRTGLDLLHAIRSRSDVPVIVTSREGVDEVDRVVGLELGADDYIGRPCGLRELLARIRALLRRRTLAPRSEPSQEILRFGNWHIDRKIRRLTGPDHAEVRLSKGLYALLIAFLEAPQRAVTREFLMHATRIHEDVFDRSIDVQILRLRRKLEIGPDAPRVIETVRGIGYSFVLAVERVPPGAAEWRREAV